MRRVFYVSLIHAIVLLLAAACVPATQNSAVGASEGIEPETPGGEINEALALDAAAYAAEQGIKLEEAMRRLEFQQTIGDIQPALEAELRDTYAGLWIQHQPEYRIVIGLTQGDTKTVAPYIAGKPWEEWVEVRQVDHSLVALREAREAVEAAARELDLAVLGSGLDITNNRVELIVGNPDAFRQALAAAGFEVPASVAVLAVDPGNDLPNTNEGSLVEGVAADGRTIFLPIQPPAYANMAALLEGTLLEMGGCLRVTSPGYTEGFLVIWPYGSGLSLDGENIDVVNGAGQVVGRVGQPVRMGGGAMESARSMGNYDEIIPGLPLENCPGPYWVAGELETMAAQAVPDIYVDPFSSDSQVLVEFLSQSRPAMEEKILTGELVLDEQKCLRVAEYAILWPPDVFPREAPLRLVGLGESEIARLGDQVRLTGGEKLPGDYRYFENKVRCAGPFWGVAEVSRID